MNYLLEGEEAIDTVSSFAKQLFVPFEGNDYRPRLLQSRILLWVVVFVLIAKIITVGFSLPFPKNIFFADITKIDLLGLLNENRQEYGLQPLVQSQVLDRAAYLKAQDMIANGYFSHESPAGVSPWFWFKEAGYSYKYAGENLAVGFADSSVVYNAWFNSPSHQANLLNKNYKEVGTAVVPGFGPNGSLVVVQLFGSPLTSVAATPVPNTTPKPAAQPLPPPPSQTVSNPKPSSEPTPEPSATQAQDVVVQEDAAEAPVAAQEPADAQVLAGSTEYVLSEPGNNTDDSLYSSLLHFMVYDNNRLLQVAAYVLLALISICLIINIGINFEIQRKDLIVRSLALIAVLYISTLIDKTVILALLPHQIII